MELLRDIAALVKDDREHNIEVKINSDGVTVYLEYDPDRDMNGQCIIPIQYDTLYESACIPQEELIEKFKPNEGGIDLGEIKLIKKIMKYMEKNKEDINELCALFDLAVRHDLDNCSEDDSSWGE